MQRIHCQKSMNAGVHRIKTNLANTHSMLMSANLFHSQNACVHCLVELIRFICSIRCSTRLFHLRMVHFVVVNNVEEINNEINRKNENAQVI